MACQDTTLPGSGVPVINCSHEQARALDPAPTNTLPSFSSSLRLSGHFDLLTHHDAAESARGQPEFRHRSSAKPRMVVMSLVVMRIPVSASMRVRSSRLPSESRPYSESGWSGSMVRRRIRPTARRPCAAAGRATRPAAARPSSLSNSLVSVELWPLDWNNSANLLRCAKAANHGVPSAVHSRCTARSWRSSASNA